jgi:hypothetical protein
MSSSPSPSAPKTSATAAIAGTLAGLLAAGLLGYYVYLQRQAAKPAPAVAATAAAAQLMAQAEPAPAPTPVPAPAPASTPAEVKASNSAPAGSRSREQATLALLQLPELKAWSAQLEKSSGGKVHGALIEDDPAPRSVHGKSYYQFSFVADGSEAAHHLESFLAARDGDEILVEDEDSEELLSLQRWRKEKHPLQRSVDEQ